MAWSPADLPGLRLWLDASQLPLADGDPVDEWTDLSGSGVPYAAPEPGRRPTFREDVIAGRAGIWFDGSDDWLHSATPGTLDPAQGLTLFAVFSPAETQVGDWNSIWQRGATVGLWYRGMSRKVSWYDGADLASIEAADVSMLAGLVISGTAASLRISGNDPATRTGTWTANVWGDGIGNDQGNERYRGHIHEIIVADVAASTEDRQLAEGYLAWRWGLVASLPEDHPHRDADPGVEPPAPEPEPVVSGDAGLSVSVRPVGVITPSVALRGQVAAQVALRGQVRASVEVLVP